MHSSKRKPDEAGLESLISLAIAIVTIAFFVLWGGQVKRNEEARVAAAAHVGNKP